MRLFLFLLIVQLTAIPAFAQKYEDQRVVTGTVLVNDTRLLDVPALMSSLKSDWKIAFPDYASVDKTITFSAPGGTVMIGQLSYPTDPIEIRAASKLSWLWPTAEEEALRHQSQIAISVVGSGNKSLELHQLFTKVAAAILENTQSSGVYMNSQYLLLPKGFYSAAAHNMLDNQTLPVYCWIYFGMPGDGGAYTFGMQDFGLKEMEIVKSGKDNSTVHGGLYDAVSTVLKYHSRPADGEFIVTEEGAKIKVHLAKGVFLEGQQVLSLEY